MLEIPSFGFSVNAGSDGRACFGLQRDAAGCGAIVATGPAHRAKRYEFGSMDPAKPSTIVAVESGVIVGFAMVAPARDPDAQGSGEVCALYIDPEWWARSVGCVLSGEGARA
jgi:hypothetical protein